MRNTPVASPARRPRATRKSAADRVVPGVTELGPAREEQIRLAAFSLYEARGFEKGHELDDWLRAEIEFDSKPPALAAH